MKLNDICAEPLPEVGSVNTVEGDGAQTNIEIGLPDSAEVAVEALDPDPGCDRVVAEFDRRVRNDAQAGVLILRVSVGLS